MRMRRLITLSAMLAGAALAFAALRPDRNLSSVFASRLATLAPGPEGPPVTEADLDHLPTPVARWLRRAGVVGRPPVRMIHVTFDATLRQGPGSPAMSGPAHQVDVIDPPRRLFFMRTRMNGLPVEVLHDYSPAVASMRVRAARLFDVVNAGGPDFARAEMVTFLNDLCAYAPSALIRPNFVWTSIDDRHAAVAFTVGSHTVTATLAFDESGDVVDFRSEDRGELQPDGTLRVLPWRTPLGGMADFTGRRVPTQGDAVYERPEGPFTYGSFVVRDVRFDEAATTLLE